MFKIDFRVIDPYTGEIVYDRGDVVPNAAVGNLRIFKEASDISVAGGSVPDDIINRIHIGLNDIRNPEQDGLGGFASHIDACWNASYVEKFLGTTSTHTRVGDSPPSNI